MKHASILLSCLLGLSMACRETNLTPPAPTTVTISYTELTEDFPNPERGFYQYSETEAGNFQPLDVQTLKSYRMPQTVGSSAYQVVSTLVFRYYVLKGLTSSPLPAAFLENLKTDFGRAREAGVKLIPRFTYSITAQPGNCPAGFICPPYGDAPKAVVLGHIEQLKPVFMENADVIACLQMGFIGTWGENYYTDYFGDASVNANQGKLLDANWQDRFTVVKALLDALPKDRMIQVRYPQLKQRYVYGVNAPVSSAALTEAFGETDKARIGFHNDCLLASADDFGTYLDYGNSNSPSRDANTPLRNYFGMDSQYVVVGGETCSDGFSPQNDCEPAGRAEKELSELHYSYLNAAYNQDVNNDWVTGGCMDNIKRKLGYRFVLKRAALPDRVAAEKELTVRIELENVGYAAPFNPRPIQLLLRSKTTGEVTAFDFSTNIRAWRTGSHQLEATFSLAATLPSGEYEVLLNPPDPYPALGKRPEYSIRLANANTWEEETGYNKLNHTLVVSP